MQITSCARSDLGRTREVNEDYHLVESGLGLYLVADGMGGHGNGEIASRVAARVIERQLRETAPRRSGRAADEADCDRLRGAIRAANLAVLSEVERDERLAGMGCTLVVMLLREEAAAIAHVGDSRAYRMRAGRLELVTEDHTWVHEQVSAGLLSEAEALSHPFRSVVTRAVGGGDEIVVDTGTVDVQRGDLLLLCSDGLNAVVSDEQIAQILRREGDPDDRCRALIAAANAGGGPDNITVLLVAVGDDD
jgi:protein phosphatase